MSISLLVSQPLSLPPSSLFSIYSQRVPPKGGGGRVPLFCLKSLKGSQLLPQQKLMSSQWPTEPPRSGCVPSIISSSVCSSSCYPSLVTPACSPLIGHPKTFVLPVPYIVCWDFSSDFGVVWPLTSFSLYSDITFPDCHI